MRCRQQVNLRRRSLACANCVRCRRAQPRSSDEDSRAEIESLDAKRSRRIRERVSQMTIAILVKMMSNNTFARLFSAERRVSKLFTENERVQLDTLFHFHRKRERESERQTEREKLRRQSKFAATCLFFVNRPVKRKSDSTRARRTRIPAGRPHLNSHATRSRLISALKLCTSTRVQLLTRGACELCTCNAFAGNDSRREFEIAVFWREISRRR